MKTISQVVIKPFNFSLCFWGVWFTNSDFKSTMFCKILKEWVEFMFTISVLIAFKYYCLHIIIQTLFGYSTKVFKSIEVALYKCLYLFICNICRERSEEMPLGCCT